MFEFFPIVYRSSLGSLIGADKLEINTFTTPEIPTPTPVFLYDQKTHQYITFFYVYNSNNLVLENIDLKNNTFFILAHDPNGTYNGVIADNIGGVNYVDS